MPGNTRTRLTVLIAIAVALVCLGGVALWYLYATEAVNPSPMKDYTAEVQQTAAQSIVAGLNTRNPVNVDLMRDHSGNADREADNARITQNIAAALPPPGCQYSLLSIEDRGEQDPADVPWFGGASRARGFDMKLQELCPEESPTPRTIRVIAIPSGMGGYWAEAALKEQA